MKLMEREANNLITIEKEIEKLTKKISEEQKELQLLEARNTMTRARIINAISFDSTKITVIISELISYLVADDITVSPFIGMKKDKHGEFAREISSVCEKDNNNNFKEIVQIYSCKYPQLERKIYDFLLVRYNIPENQRLLYIETIKEYKFGKYDSIIKELMMYLAEAQYNIGKELDYDELEILLQSFLGEKRREQLSQGNIKTRKK